MLWHSSAFGVPEFTYFAFKMPAAFNGSSAARYSATGVNILIFELLNL
jgi:hypothetical protein